MVDGGERRGRSGKPLNGGEKGVRLCLFRSITPTSAGPSLCLNISPRRDVSCIWPSRPPASPPSPMPAHSLSRPVGAHHARGGALCSRTWGRRRTGGAGEVGLNGVRGARDGIDRRTNCHQAVGWTRTYGRSPLVRAPVGLSSRRSAFLGHRTAPLRMRPIAAVLLSTAPGRRIFNTAARPLT